MITKELVDYVGKQLASGLSREQIAVSLGGGDWSSEDIQEAFSVLVQPNPPVPAVPVAAPIPAPSVPERRSKKKLLILIALFILLVTGAVGAYFFYRGDSQKASSAANQMPPVEQNALPVVEDISVAPEPSKPSIVSYVKVPVEENNAPDFNAMDVSVVKNEDRNMLSKYMSDPASTSTISSADSQRMLDAYSNILKAFEAAMVKKYYQCSIAVEACDYSILRVASNIALLKAINLQEQGRHAEAIAYVNNVITLGRQVTATADSDIELLVGWQIQRNGYGWFSKIGGPQSSADEIKNLVATLRSEHRNVLNFLYTRVVETIDYITSKDNKLSFTLNSDFGEEEYLEEFRKVANPTSWKPEETKNMFFVSTQKALSHTDLPCGSVYEDTKIDKDFDIKDTSLANQANFVGRSFYATVYASLGDMNVKRCEVERALGAL